MYFRDAGGEGSRTPVSFTDALLSYLFDRQTPPFGSPPALVLPAPFLCPVGYHVVDILCGIPHVPELLLLALFNRLLQLKETGTPALIYSDHIPQRGECQALLRHLPPLSLADFLAIVPEGSLQIPF